MLWSWWAISGLLWVWRNRRGPHLKLKTNDTSNADIVTVFCGHIHSFWLNNKYHQKGEITVDENGDIDLSKIDNTPFIDTGIVNLDSYSYKSGKVNVYVLEI